MQTYLIDTNIFLNVLRNEEPYSSSSSALLSDVETSKVKAVASTITLAEILVGAYKAGTVATKEISLALSKLEAKGFRFVPVDKVIASKGAKVRAAHGLKLPDSLIAATALISNANSLITRDKKIYAGVEDLRIETPEELGY